MAQRTSRGMDWRAGLKASGESGATIDRAAWARRKAAAGARGRKELDEMRSRARALGAPVPGLCNAINARRRRCRQLAGKCVYHREVSNVPE